MHHDRWTSCTIDDHLADDGHPTVSAHTTVTVGGVSLTRTTNGTGANSGPAVKTWVNATISITPNATNEVSAPHTFTSRLMKDTGTGTLVPAAGETVTVTLTSQRRLPGRRRVPAPGTTDAAGQCAVTFTSLPGQGDRSRLEHAAINGSAPFTVATDNSGGNSGDATKVFGREHPDHPATATNRVGASHTFTAHVNVNIGDGGGFQNAPDGTPITFTIDANGAPRRPTRRPSAPPRVAPDLHDDAHSPTTGTSTVSAHTTFTTSGGVILTRTRTAPAPTPARRSRPGSTPGSRSRPTRPTRSASRTPSRSCSRRTSVTARASCRPPARR